MELNFNLEKDRWVAYFEAKADFNLHIEGVIEGNVSLFQRGTGSGNYAYVKEGTPHPSYANVYDYDFTSLVYPKFIKVSCATEPTFAEVTSNGEVTELKYQEKEVEITSNGTTAIAPDAGFSAMTNVRVKVNVPQSGEGGGSEGGGSSLEYYDISAMGFDPIQNPEAFSAGLSFWLIKMEQSKKTLIGNYQFVAGAFDSNDSKALIVAAAVDPNEKLYNGGEVTTIGEFYAKIGLNLSTLPRLTKEEFYHIPEDVVLRYRDYEKLKEVFERVYNTLAAEGMLEDLPVDTYWYDVPKIDFPISQCGYRSISAETNAYGDIYGNDIIGRVWKQTYEFSSNDFWFDYDKDENFDYSNVEATYFEVLDTNYALCKIQSQDGSAKYILRMLM